jgi:chemotaxis protein histidine kinase CheA
VNGRDPELTRLLILELSRHLVTLEEGDRDVEASRRAVHALKGSAGLAGEQELANALQRLERRLREDDRDALGEVADLVRVAIARLAAGDSAMLAEWPSPPDNLVALRLEAMSRAQYVAEVTDRLARIDEALGTAKEPVESAMAIFRHVHTLKGAASAVGDEPMSWFCHGLEDRIQQGGRSRDDARVALQEVARWRAVLGGLVDDADSALSTLRLTYGLRPVSAMPASGLRDDEPRPGGLLGAPAGEEATVRVSAASVDRLIDRFVSLGVARERVAARGERARDSSRELRRLRSELGEALRLIGPPRPWGAPAAALRRIARAANALGEIGDELEQAASDLRITDQALKDGVSEARVHLAAMRQLPIRRTFARLATAVEAEARREGRHVRVRTTGGDETIDRRLAESLVEPCLQLARNSVAHGIEPTSTRVALGKPAMATLTLAAVKVGSRLRISIEDDGAGVDVDAVRARAVQTGAVTAALAEAADDHTLLALLFLPGFSTRESSDLLAGRGIGLDIALGAVQRLGGSIRLASKHGVGFEARIEVPVESGLASVLWVTAGGVEHALLAAHARVVRINDGADADRVPHLAACLEPRANERAPYAIELDVDDGVHGAPLVIGVDVVGRTEEARVRPLTTLVAGLGPYAGAIVGGDGKLRLAVDPFALAPRARALGRVPDGRVSDFPPSRPPPPPSPSS